MSIHMKRSSPHSLKTTEFAEPFKVLSDEFLFAFQYLGNWDSPLPLLSYLLYFHICHKSHSFPEPVFLLHHYISLLRLPRAYVQHFCLSFLHSFSSSKTHIKDVHGGGVERSTELCAAQAVMAPPPLIERSGKFPHFSY
uniref:Uncharacterized protein n=1 Tax=Theropithecus gelada TaxID=9565 RepID=A0A8D2G3F5_THEGE